MEIRKTTPAPWELTDEDTFDMGCRAIEEGYGAPVCHVETWADNVEESRPAPSTSSSASTPTGIRCAINDALDSMDRQGRAVPDDNDGFGYDQESAIREVREIVGKTDFQDRKRRGI